MKEYKQASEKEMQAGGESGFTLIEVAIASVISMIGLMALASLFTYAIYQNKQVKQYTATTAMAQQKLEELNAIEKTDSRLNVGGSLTEAGKQTGYWDEVFVNEKTGVVSTTIPSGETANYRRYWQVEEDPELDYTVLVIVRVVATQASRGRSPEETTLVSIRSFNK
jgi:Tfp pilus assembly protein PilV